MDSISTHSPPAVRPGGTRLRLDGADALDLLHRISTQLLTNLEPGESRVTLFCDFRGRLLHRATITRGADATVWVVRDDAPAAELRAHLERHLFREDVRITEIPPDATDTAAAEASAESEIARIRAGAPRHGHEIAEDFTPFEVGLAHEVHLRKGCFTGQEALLRLVTYRSVRRALVRVEGEGDAPALRSELREGDEKVGVVTSAAGGSNHWCALAVVKVAALESGQPLMLADSGRAVRCTPFPPTRPLGLE